MPQDGRADAGELTNAASRRERFLLVFPSVALPMFIAMADPTMVATALPAIAAGLGSIEYVSTLIVAYLIAVTIAAPVYGRLGDMFGRKQLLLIALCCVGGASIVAASASNMEVLIAARFLQGLGGGGLITLSQSLIGEHLPPRDRAHYQSYLSTVLVSATAFGPVAGGLLTEYFGWRAVFVANIPTCIVAFLLALRLPARTSTTERERFDWSGLFLLAIFVTTLLLALEVVKVLRWSVPGTLTALLLAALCALLLLIWHERRCRSPLLPMPLFFNPSILRSALLAACHGGALIALIAFLPLYMRVVHGVSVSTAGLMLLSATLGLGAGSAMTGQLMSRTGRTTLFPSMLLIGATLLMLGFCFWGDRLSLPQLLVFLAILGLCMGSVMPVVQITTQGAAPPGMLGSAAGFVMLSRAIGSAFGTTLFATVLFLMLANGDSQSLHVFERIAAHGGTMAPDLAADAQAVVVDTIVNALHSAFLVIAVALGLGAITAWLIPIKHL